MYRENNSIDENVIAVNSLTDALNEAQRKSPTGQVFILGGTGVYKEGLEHPDCECVFITKLQEHPPMPCDAYFPGDLLVNFSKTSIITAQCYDILSPKLLKSTTIVLSDDKRTVREGEITYLVKICCK